MPVILLNSVGVTIRSTIISKTLVMGNKSKFDLNLDDVYDLSLELIEVDNKKVKIRFLAIEEDVCGKEGKFFSENNLEGYVNSCCDGFLGYVAGTNLSVSVEDVCYGTNLLNNNSLGICLNCGNGVCEEIENVCNCPEDCIGKNLSGFNDSWEFFESEGWELYCGDDDSKNLPLCLLCDGYVNLGEFELIGDFCGSINSNLIYDPDLDSGHWEFIEGLGNSVRYSDKHENNSAFICR